MATTAASSSKMEMNPRGIPRAPFVADVAEYIAGKNGDVEGVVKTFQETSAKYRYMELSLQQRRKALTTKIPDIDQTLNVVKYLQLRRRKAAGEEITEETDGDEDDDLDDLEEPTEEGALKTLFELNDTLYAEAEIEETGEVGIWLGANTMLLYPLDEANELLSTKLAAAKKSLEETVEDLEWLREQVTVMDVNFARVHNWDVKR
ncbi:Prefoldin subunit-domain-containing protein [Naematelia encephala]|uniref:Prefoldin subunit 3 n=1 Tax=Naematelia encephala TaxID=71784 RepID=A0A1Y2AZZ4_9TREE|nr:Prefoldin subunit-domain-containing protein [Naematelia encephala]